MRTEFFTMIADLNNNEANEIGAKSNAELIVIMTTDSPFQIKEKYIQRISDKQFFFDFLSLQNFKVALAQIVTEIELKLSSSSQFIGEDEGDEYGDYNDDEYGYDDDYYKRKMLSRMKGKVKSDLPNNNSSHINDYKNMNKNSINQIENAKNSNISMRYKSFRHNRRRYRKLISFFEIKSKKYYGDDDFGFSSSNNYGSDYSSYNSGYGGYDSNYGDQYSDGKNEGIHPNCIVPENIPDIQIIAKDETDIGIEKRDVISVGADLLSTDNVIYIAGPHSCIKFDKEFQEFIMNTIIPNKNEEDTNIKYDKTGLTVEDLENVVRLCLHKYLFLESQKKELLEQERDHFPGNEHESHHHNSFTLGNDEEKNGEVNIFTELSIKGALLKYVPNINHEKANIMIEWFYKFKKIQGHLKSISSKLSESFLPNRKRSRRSLMAKFMEKTKNQLDSNQKKNVDSQEIVEYPPNNGNSNSEVSQITSKLNDKIMRMKRRVNKLYDSDSYPSPLESNKDLVSIKKSNLMSFIADLHEKIKNDEKGKFLQKLNSVKSNLQSFRSSKTANNEQLTILDKISKVEDALNNMKSSYSFDSKNQLINDITSSINKMEIEDYNIENNSVPLYKADESAIINADTNILPKYSGFQ